MNPTSSVLLTRLYLVIALVLKTRVPSPESKNFVISQKYEIPSAVKRRYTRETRTHCFAGLGTALQISHLRTVRDPVVQ